MTKQFHFAIPTALAVFAGLLVPAHATTIISGDLFFATFQNQGGQGGITPSTNVWKVSFTYDSVTKLTLQTPVAIKTLTGADGLMFDPNDPTNHTLLIGEQNSNRVMQMSTDGTTLLNEKKADASQSQVYGGAQAYTALRANIDETESAAIITERGGQENHRERSQNGSSFCSQFA